MRAPGQGDSTHSIGTTSWRWPLKGGYLLTRKLRLVLAPLVAEGAQEKSQLGGPWVRARLIAEQRGVVGIECGPPRRALAWIHSGGQCTADPTATASAPD